MIRHTSRHDSAFISSRRGNQAVHVSLDRRQTCQQKRNRSIGGGCFSPLSILLSRSASFSFGATKSSTLSRDLPLTKLDRFLWCLSASFFGFFILAFHLRRVPESPFPAYVTYYPAILVAQSALVFSVTHFFTASSGFTFYYLSFAVCFILAVTIDNFWTLISSLASKGANR